MDHKIAGFASQYQKFNAQIVPDETCIRAVVKQAQELERKRNAKGICLWKPAAALTSVCVCLYFAVPALAASSDSVYQMMYRISPQIAQHFMPVQKSDVDQGIKMEVLSASIQGSKAEIYLTMQDLEGERIDETTDLFDSYQINCPFDSSSHCERIGYDADTKTVTFLITMEQWGNRDIRGDKITFSVSDFLSGKKTYEHISIPVDVSLAADTSRTQSVSIRGGSASDDRWFAQLDQDQEALIPSSPMQEFPVDGIGLTGIGYVDGRLHIQTMLGNVLENDNHGFFWLQDRQGEEVYSSYTFSFFEETKQGERVDYNEEVFELARDQLAGYQLYGHFVTAEKKIKGAWRVTFPLEMHPDMAN